MKKILSLLLVLITLITLSFAEEFRYTLDDNVTYGTTLEAEDFDQIEDFFIDEGIPEYIYNEALETFSETDYTESLGVDKYPEVKEALENHPYVVEFYKYPEPKLDDKYLYGFMLHKKDGERYYVKIAIAPTELYKKYINIILAEQFSESIWS